MSSVRVILFPASEKLFEANVIELNDVPSEKLFEVLVRTDPENTRSSPAEGATSPTQLAAVIQLLLAPPPSQVTTAKRFLCSSDSPPNNRRPYAVGRFATRRRLQEKPSWVNVFSHEEGNLRIAVLSIARVLRRGEGQLLPLPPRPRPEARPRELNNASDRDERKEQILKAAGNATVTARSNESAGVSQLNWTNHAARENSSRDTLG